MTNTVLFTVGLTLRHNSVNYVHAQLLLHGMLKHILMLLVTNVLRQSFDTLSTEVNLKNTTMQKFGLHQQVYRNESRKTAHSDWLNKISE